MFGKAGSPNQAFFRRITSDPNAFQLYARSGLTLAPAITAVSATARRICIARGNATFRDGIQNGTKHTTASSIGDFDILTIGRVATSFFSGTLHNLLIAHRILTDAECNDECNYLASLTDAGAVSWTNL